MLNTYNTFNIKMNINKHNKESLDFELPKSFYCKPTIEEINLQKSFMLSNLSTHAQIGDFESPTFETLEKPDYWDWSF